MEGGQLGSIILSLFGSLVLVFFATAIFVNAIEYVAARLRLGSSFVSTIIAPLFTSLPELIVFMVAIFIYRGATGQSIAIGAVFGQPFMASSLSYGLVGLAVLVGFLLRRRKQPVLAVDKSLAIPYIFVVVFFPFALVPGLFHAKVMKYLWGLAFLAAFVVYTWIMFRRKREGIVEEAEESYLYRACYRLRPEAALRHATTISLLQIAVAVGLLYFGSERLVHSVGALATDLGISALGVSLVVVPAATAIPETTSALLWGYRGKDTLSIGSLVGEKVLYCTFYPALGLFLTTWALDKHAYFSVATTTVISLILLYYILRGRFPWWGLMFGLLSFLAYAILVFAFQF